MRKRIYFSFLALFLSALVALPALGQSEWVKAMGGAGNDWATSTTEASGQDILVTGITAYGAGGGDLLLAKFNSSGTLQWTKALGGTYQDGGRSVIVASDGSIIVAGFTFSFEVDEKDFMLCKFNSSGVHQWTRTLGGIDEEDEETVVETSDGGFAMAGWTESFGAGSSDVLLCKFNSSGTHQWTKTLGGTSGDGAKGLVELDDGSLVVIGGTSSYGAGSGDLMLCKFNSSGTHQWTRTLGGTGNETGQSIMLASDGSIVVVGYTNSYGAGGYDLLLAKFNSLGTHQWTRVLGGSGTEEHASVTEASDGGYVMTGWTDSYGAGNTDFLISKYNSAGTHQWTRVVGGTSYEYAYWVTGFSDGGFVVTGSTASYGAGSSDVWLSKHASDGTTCLGSSVTPSLASPSPSIGSPSPTVSSQSPDVSAQSPTLNLPNPDVEDVCDSGEPVPVPIFSTPMLVIMVLAILIGSLLVIKRRVTSKA